MIKKDTLFVSHPKLMRDNFRPREPGQCEVFESAGRPSVAPILFKAVELVRDQSDLCALPVSCSWSLQSLFDRV
jgi:hypothetical protein